MTKLENQKEQGDFLNLPNNKITNIGISSNRLTNKQFSWSLKAKTNSLPDKFNLKIKNLLSLNISSLCRKCHKKEETRDHILNGCIYMAKFIKSRHDNVLNILIKNANLKRAKFKIDKNCSKNNKLRPNLIFNPNSLYDIFIDVAITSNSTNHLHLGHQMKIDKYINLINKHKLIYNKNLKIIHAIFSSLGSYHPENFNLYNELNIPKKQIIKLRQDITISIIKNLNSLYNNFIKNTFIHDTSK